MGLYGRLTQKVVGILIGIIYHNMKEKKYRFRVLKVTKNCLGSDLETINSTSCYILQSRTFFGWINERDDLKTRQEAEEWAIHIVKREIREYKEKEALKKHRKELKTVITIEEEGEISTLRPNIWEVK